MKLKEFSKKLVEWQPIAGRNNLPWQRVKEPYPVWVSEIMLQQTQVDTALKYYDNFLDTFPDIETLANADEEMVLNKWSGLGFYRRAINLHKCAKIIHQEHQGLFPKTHKDLVKLPGIGASTASAIMSICYQEPEAIFDGNVKRVLSRYFHWNIDEIKEKEMLEVAKKLVYRPNPAIYSQAIMDLGATVCTKHNPKCDQCPVNDHCESVKKGLLTQAQKKKVRVMEVEYHYVIIHQNNQWLFARRPKTGIWAKMWGFIEFNHQDELNKNFHQSKIKKIKTVHHVLSHRKMRLNFYLTEDLSYLNSLNSDSIHWQSLDQALSIATPKPFTDIFKEHSYETHSL